MNRQTPLTVKNIHVPSRMMMTTRRTIRSAPKIPQTTPHDNKPIISAVMKTSAGIPAMPAFLCSILLILIILWEYQASDDVNRADDDHCSDRGS
jgi:hypothetical protein